MNPFWHCWWLESHLVQFVEKPLWGKIISVTLCGEPFFFSLSLSLLFGEILCHVNTMMFFLIIIISFFSHWLTLWISAQPLARRPPLHLHSYQKAPKLPKWVTLSCLFLWEAKAQNWHFHQFLYMAKKTQLCQVSQYTHNYHTNVVMNVLWVVEQRKDI